MKFGDRQNLINNSISTGVHGSAPNPEQLNNVPNNYAPTNAIQHDILIENVSDDEHDDSDDDEDSE